MSEVFIRTRSGALNLRFVREIRERQRSDGTTYYAVIKDDGTETSASMGEQSLDLLCHRILPAQPGDRAVFLAVDEDVKAPTIENVWEQHVQVVGWGISTNYGGRSWGIQPLYSDEPGSNQIALVRCPDGSWDETGVQIHKTLDAAKAEVLQRYLERPPAVEVADA